MRMRAGAGWPWAQELEAVCLHWHPSSATYMLSVCGQVASLSKAQFSHQEKGRRNIITRIK